MITPNAAIIKRNSRVFLRRLSLGWSDEKYNIAAKIVNNKTDKMLFEVQWWPEKFFSQSLSGAESSAQTVIIAINAMVMIAASAEEKISRGLFILL